MRYEIPDAKTGCPFQQSESGARIDVFADKDLRFDLLSVAHAEKGFRGLTNPHPKLL